jgi:S-adenosylmethionine synthetase
LYRTGENLVKVDICHPEEVDKIIQEFKPSCIVHCAAQRFPDKVEKDKDGTIQLNINATKHLATTAGKLAVYQNNIITNTHSSTANNGITMLYISTDYVFDGVKPPYSEDSTPNPLNTYGETKLQGEVVTLETFKGKYMTRSTC